MAATKKKSFIAGMLTMALLFGLVGSAYAAYQQQATLNYSGINIFMDGELVIPTDANGDVVEPFTIDGTTYLPVRAISNALGLDVSWDGKNNAVVLSSPVDDDYTYPFLYEPYGAFIVPSLENVVGRSALINVYIPETGSGAMYFYDPAKFDLPDDQNFAEEYFSILERCGFHYQESELNLVIYTSERSGISVATSWDDTTDHFIVTVFPSN